MCLFLASDYFKLFLKLKRFILFAVEGWKEHFQKTF